MDRMTQAVGVYLGQEVKSCILARWLQWAFGKQPSLSFY